MSRRGLLGSLTGLGWLAAGAGKTRAQARPGEGVRFTDVSAEAGLRFRHSTGAQGRKWLPETMGPGCAFLDYDGDGWQDLLLLDSGPLDGQTPATHSGIRLFQNQRNGTFREVTREAGLWQPMYALGVAVGDFNNNGFPDVYVTGLGQNRLFANLGNGRFRDVTVQAGLGNRTAFSTSAAWVDFDRDGYLDLFVCNYVRWQPDRDIYCSSDGKNKSYCTPEAYDGSTCWLFRNRGDGAFEDVTVSSGIFDRTSKALGVVALDVNQDGWPDLFVANDTQPNKLYRNLRNGRFQEVGLELGVAFSEDGKARAGMGADAGDLTGSGRESLVVTNFENEMAGLYVPGDQGEFVDR
ncbi:MAG: VCBS repeat-containing protein, partial [Bryobacterales bacterium]|nr:VCBS repeat-containing protein [Bryobacterales bacterium]